MTAPDEKKRILLPSIMLIFALFTSGYFLGVVTALLIFPPQAKEIAQQEEDALGPVLGLSRVGEAEASVEKQPSLASV